MVTLVADVETDGFLAKLTRIWTIQVGDAAGGDVIVYSDEPGYPPLVEAAERLKAADLTVWHNGLGFDLWVVNRFFPGTIDPEKVYDTLVAERLRDPDALSHRLEDLGKQLGILKGTYTGDFQTFTQDLVDYARQDVVVTRALYHRCCAALKDWGGCVDTEMRFAWVMALQEKNGFGLDVAACHALEEEFRGELAVEDAALRQVFQPLWVPERTAEGIVTFTPKTNNKRMGYSAGAALTKVALQEFNPGSRHQVAARLRALGWKPQRFGKDGSPTVDDDVLVGLPWPEAKRLVRYYTIKKKLEQICDGRSSWMKWVTPAGTVHGRVNTAGAASGRCSHSSPNVAQANKKDHRMRACWTPTRPGWVLVGCDGEGLQARVLAHYLARYDGGSYAQKIVEGSKADKTDEHSSNLKWLPFLNVAFEATGEVFSKARDGAKTCLYCVLFGGQDPKLGRTVKEACKNAGLPIPRVPDRELGAGARKALFRAIRGFEQLYEAIQGAARRGYLTGLDGRRIRIRSKHSALVFLMQGGEAAVMKLAARIFHFESAPAAGLRYGEDFAYCAHVHDEAQVECRPEVAELVGATYEAAIAEAGVRLGSRCQIKGAASKPGRTWADTH